MKEKMLFRLRMALYVVLLILAELLETSVVGGISLGIVHCVMPIPVACIAMFEGAERGGIFGLVGGCLWAWSSSLSYYGAYTIVALTCIGVAAGMLTERFLLRGVKTTLCYSAGALLLTEGVYTLAGIFSGRVPVYALLTVFFPGALISLGLGLLMYLLTSFVSRIGGSYG